MLIVKPFYAKIVSFQLVKTKVSYIAVSFLGPRVLGTVSTRNQCKYIIGRGGSFLN